MIHQVAAWFSDFDFGFCAF